MTQSGSGVQFHFGHGSLALLFGLSLVDEPSQVLADGRWLLVDHSSVCSFYVNLIGWWVGLLQKLLLKLSYHLVQGRDDLLWALHNTYYHIVQSLCSSSKHAHLVEVLWYLLVIWISSDHTHWHPAGEGLKLCDVPLKTLTNRFENSLKIQQENSRTVKYMKVNLFHT